MNKAEKRWWPEEESGQRAPRLIRGGGVGCELDRSITPDFGQVLGSHPAVSGATSDFTPLVGRDMQSRWLVPVTPSSEVSWSGPGNSLPVVRAVATHPLLK